MFPVLFEAGGFKLYSYGFFIAMGYLAALALGRSLAKERNLEPAPYMDLGLVAILTGVAGGRILFVLTNFGHYRQHPLEVFDFWQGGLVFYGGFLLALLASALFLRHKKMPLLTSLDIMAPSVALAHGLGRIGCLGAGCCHGSYCPYPWGISLRSDFVDASLQGKPLHPTQLYEAAALFLLAGALVWIFCRRKMAAGGVALLYVVAYALIRSVVEIFRGDQIRGFVLGQWLSTSQAIALLLLLGSGLLFLRRFRSQNL